METAAKWGRTQGRMCAVKELQADLKKPVIQAPFCAQHPIL
jgi:hypothetical protein